MAQPTPESKLLSDPTGQEVKEQALESAGGEVGAAGAKHVDTSSPSTPSVAVPDPHSEKSSSQNSTNAQSTTSSSRPSLVPLGSGNVQTSLTTPVAPHPKRFSAVNINKKFLEKNTASGTATSSSSSSIAKSGNTATRPSVQPTSSHSRLVTAKLTASPAVASTAAGWSRPSSVAPSPATNSPNSTSPMPIAPVSQPSATAAPQLPHVGKVILPQPRNAVPQMSSSQKESGNAKPVWGNIKPPVVRPDLEPNDFPTAAEVANVASTLRKQTKAAEETKTAADNAAKLLRSEEADAFRGVHLDPNVHHWDEMEEDDDNFLGGVIEFGDGRQYKIESSESNQPGTLPTGNFPRSQADESHLKESTVPVSKEERFVDDFDRSWPKSRNSPASAPNDVPQSAAPHTASPSVSPVVSHATHSPQDSSRVLFNERSNRLEPYSQAHRQQPGSFGSKRSQLSEGSGVAQDHRSSRDGHNIQVLQKPVGPDFNSRRFSGSNGSYTPGPTNGFVGDRNRDREQFPRRDGPPPSPRLPRDHPGSLGIDIGSRDLNNDRGRRGNMGPPPVPLHAAVKHSQESGRQLPPHLSQVSPNTPSKRLPSQDSRFSPAESPAGLPASISGPPHSPAVSHASLSVVSPVIPPNANFPLSAPELDEVRKDVMHTAAERAKQRRQQEEEEREALKERARRKAQEIEEKIKAEKEKQQQKEEEASLAAAAKEKEAIQLIEAAVKTAEPSLKTGSANSSEPNSRRLSLQRPPSLRAVPRTESSRPARRLSTTTPRPIPVPPSPAAQTESWRARVNPIPTSPRPRQIQSRAPLSSTFISSGPSAAEQVESIADGSKDDLEVVDFSDMGKFVGISDAPEIVLESSKEVPSPAVTSSRASRPVASDFFDEVAVTEPSISSLKQADFGAWRRKVSQEMTEPSGKIQDSKPYVVDEIKQADSSLTARDRISPIKDQPTSREEVFSTETSAFSTKESFNPHDGGQTVHVPHNITVQRTPRTQAFYKEATMSALDDAMSRIKGVLVTMQTHESPKDVSLNTYPDQDTQPSRTIPSNYSPVPILATPARVIPRDRWIPPQLRPRKFDDNDEPREVFLVTALQPPMSPPPAGRSTLCLPSVSHPVDFINKKQLHAFFRPSFQARMDILSFDPPVADMNRRDLSLNDVLFRKPAYYKGRINYRVVLPRRRGPKVNIPSVAQTKINGVGAFGRPTNADGAATWRNTVTSSSAKVDFAIELDTTSRSPPPDSTPPETHVASIPKSSDNSPTKSDSNSAVRPRAQPKMPAGSAVAFRRDSRIIEADATPMVNFIVGSQLDDDVGSQPSPPISQRQLEEMAMLEAPGTNGVVQSTTSTSSSAGDRTRAFAPSKVENSDSSNEHLPTTPPTHHSTGSWSRSSVSLPMKDSPARAPDPEHLKAVWSQTSNKAGLHAVNSLEGIADDLTALPFTLQDVKSEDGETPPPSLPSAPSRMSLHDVTRAFQTVPTSSASSQPQHRASFSPPSTHAPVARPTTATYPYPPVPQNSMRPTAYVPYPSPMMSHSPAPVMYGHPMTSSPVPSRVQLNGHTPLYSQPMWMTVPPSTQPHSNMMRPVGPYAAQMMPYPAPGYGPQPPPPNMMPVTPQAQGAGRGRGIPAMSPAMSHAHAHPGSAMYSSSPVMLHAVQVPQNHGYMPIPAGRGQSRADNGQMPAQPPAPPQQQQQQLSAHNGHHQPSHNVFNPAPTQPFVRPTW